MTANGAKKFSSPNTRQLHCQAGERARSLRAGLKTNRSVAELCQGLESGSDIEEINTRVLAAVTRELLVACRQFFAHFQHQWICRKAGVRCMLVVIRGRSRGR